jgi:hypothetical protein
MLSILLKLNKNIEKPLFVKIETTDLTTSGILSVFDSGYSSKTTGELGFLFR